MISTKHNHQQSQLVFEPHSERKAVILELAKNKYQRINSEHLRLNFHFLGRLVTYFTERLSATMLTVAITTS